MIEHLENGNARLEVRIQKSEMDDFLECSEGRVKLENAAVSESPFSFIFEKLDKGYAPLIVDRHGKNREFDKEEKFCELVTAPLDEIDCKVEIIFNLSENFLDKYADLKEKCRSPTYSEFIRRSLKVWIEAYKIVKDDVLLLVHPDEKDLVCISYKDNKFIAGIYKAKE